MDNGRSRGRVGRRNTKVVNNACDLCNRRLLHVQPVPRNSTLRNRSTSKHHRCTCAPTAISGPSCIAEHPCCVHSCSSLRAALARYVSRHYLPYVDTSRHHWSRFLRLIEYPLSMETRPFSARLFIFCFILSRGIESSVSLEKNCCKFLKDA